MSDIGVISLGCSKNLVDTEQMLGILTAAGHRIVQDPAQAQVLIVNTCGFIEPAKQESIDTILELAQYKQHGRCKTLAVTGCLSERYRAELPALLPEVDIWLGVREYEKLPQLIDNKLPVASCQLPEHPRVLTTPPYRAYLRIADGCDNRCAYCAIPLIRGKLKSEPMAALIDEAKRLADAGVTELTLIAQDTSGYGADLFGESRLIRLLEQLDQIGSLRWIRVLYTYPDTVRPALIDALTGLGKLVPYLDMPLQHVNDRILAAMRRRGDKRHITSVLEYIRSHAPEMTLRTTMLLGFPGETDAEFAELMRFLREYPFDRVGAFVFSPEEGTPAADMPRQVEQSVKEARLNALMAQQKGISKQRNGARIGTETTVLVERVEEARVIGRSPAEAPDVDGVILLPLREGVAAGQYLPVRLTSVHEYDMMGVYL